MGKIKEIQAGYKCSENYNSASVSFIAEVDSKEDATKIAKQLVEKAKAIVENQHGETKEEPKEEKKKYPKSNKEDWTKCPDCNMSLKKGAMKYHEEEFYCGACKKVVVPEEKVE